MAIGRSIIGSIQPKLIGVSMADEIPNFTFLPKIGLGSVFINEVYLSES